MERITSGVESASFSAWALTALLWTALTFGPVALVGPTRSAKTVATQRLSVAWRVWSQRRTAFAAARQRMTERTYAGGSC